ncbi:MULTISPECIES: DUF2800 domain-containing protein [unclassified Shinella]|uniref:DUF2800 domain-containing protein n=1 Tax=unclassified Shinella TaxID=2643062 RepID=UPI00225D452C|nr:conserved hypothetical protein [Rhizobiaceae bacterium]CAK7259135.1 DUF2800 domain-containing protein [Shinella sp. WSC3-e]
MVEHSARDHAQWSASATERNWNCPGALALTDGLPETTNEAADWGTAAHQIAEKCLRQGVQADSFIGETEKGKKHSFEVDEEMADTAQQYVSYVREVVVAAAPPKTNPADLLHIEQKFSLASLNPPFEAGGTADAVIYKPLTEELEVVDLKGGRGHVVEAIGNPQLRTYALGAMLANKGLKVKTIKVTIVQPRAPHKDGRIRSESFHVVDLMEWTTDLLAAMLRTADAMSDFENVDHPGFGLSRARWNAEYLSAGPHCKFCRAAGFCPALEQKALDAAGVWFDDLDQPRISNAPDSMDPAELAKRLDMLDMIGEWINAVRAYAHAQAEIGVEIPGYQLVEKIGHRKWKADVDIQNVIDVLENAGKDRDLAYAPAKPASPAQVEKALGAKHKADIADLIERSVTGTNLVAANKTSRPAATPAVNKHFDILD